MGNTLKEFLYLIRYQDISNEDFSDKIVPYQMLFPKDLWDNVLRYYLVPSRQQTLNLNLLPSRKSKIETMYSRLESTTIINKKLILLFASWIDKKSTPYSSPKEVKYEFKLLYRSSRDGLKSEIFHQKCDNINKTLVVAKVQNTDQLVGGYNPLNWNGNRIYKRTSESYISNSNDVNTAQLSYVINNDYDYAIYCYPSCLPYFVRGTDIYFCLNSNYTEGYIVVYKS